MSNQQGSTDEFSQRPLGRAMNGAVADGAQKTFEEGKVAQEKTEYARVHAAFVQKMSIARESKDRPLGARVRNAQEAIQLAFKVGPTGATLLSSEDLAAAVELHTRLVEQHALSEEDASVR